ncbi:PLDc N-terminal domain-containing protein [Alienimonas sp. DA493]|uniref:PLDc N-terminal domain-containing protein n=1 Tax=Alienimonas sp. DA493 TaxID=3373605 RepID=UPI003754F9B2
MSFFLSLVGLLAVLLCVVLVVLLAGVQGWLLADVLRHEPDDGWGKLGWAYVVLLTPPWGGALYFFLRRPERLREYGE